MNHKIYRLKPGGIKFVAVTLAKFDCPRKQSVKFTAVFGPNLNIDPKRG